jgi:hypothetical protein
MIIQELALYEEAKQTEVVYVPVKQTQLPSMFPQVTKEELEQELEVARMLDIKEGQTYRYKQSGVCFRIARIETNHVYVKHTNKDPAPFMCVRPNEFKEIPFSAAELISAHMELVQND